MKIQGTQKVEVEITAEEHKYLALDYIYSKLGWKSEYFIEEGNVCRMVTYATSHSWVEKEFVRKATDSDKALFSILKELK